MKKAFAVLISLSFLVILNVVPVFSQTNNATTYWGPQLLAGGGCESVVNVKNVTPYLQRGQIRYTFDLNQPAPTRSANGVLTGEFGWEFAIGGFETMTLPFHGATDTLVGYFSITTYYDANALPGTLIRTCGDQKYSTPLVQATNQFVFDATESPAVRTGIAITSVGGGDGAGIVTMFAFDGMGTLVASTELDFSHIGQIAKFPAQYFAGNTTWENYLAKNRVFGGTIRIVSDGWPIAAVAIPVPVNSTSK